MLLSKNMNQEDVVREFIKQQIANSPNSCLRNPDICNLLLNNHITTGEYTRLGFHALYALEKESVRQLIINRHVTIEQLITLGEPLIALGIPLTYYLRLENLVQLIHDGHITMDQLYVIFIRPGRNMRLTNLAECGYRLFTGGHITIAQYNELDNDAADALGSFHVCELFINGLITFEQYAALNKHAYQSLAPVYQSAGVCPLIINGRMTIEQLARINNHGLEYAITQDGTLQRIMAGELDVEDIVGPVIQPLIRRGVVNDNQSTHASSVHRSASKSAIKLLERYKNQIQGIEAIHVVLDLLTQDILSNTNTVMEIYNRRERDCVPSSKTCIQRLAASEYIDHTSKISTRQLLALAYLAIKDKRVLLCDTAADAFESLVRGLYEIERGYNIENVSKDNEGTPSGHICPPGTFNKIIEKLVGVHPDCDIIFVNGETVTLKIKVTVLANIAKYIATNDGWLDNFSSLEDGKVFADDDWIGIWDSIKDSVERDINAYYDDEKEDANSNISQLIVDNINAYTVSYCPLDAQDMAQINRFISEHKHEKQQQEGIITEPEHSPEFKGIEKNYAMYCMQIARNDVYLRDNTPVDPASNPFQVTVWRPRA